MVLQVATPTEQVALKLFSLTPICRNGGGIGDILFLEMHAHLFLKIHLFEGTAAKLGDKSGLEFSY